ncbi:hypothetical protein ACIRJM_46125 [Streptomyces sp. NPDC102405]|uniref:hypothetical protein n=1 Tax=Streptomyces sp. NPDC102405 TaxID=3366170 RepID=UPI00382838BB
MGRYNEQATMLIDGVAYPVQAKLEGYFESEETQSFSGKSRVRGTPSGAAPCRRTLRT